MLFQADTESPEAVAFSPSGRRLVTTTHTWGVISGTHPLVVTGWDLKTGKKLSEVSGPAGAWRGVVAAASESAAIVCSTEQIWVADFERGGKGDVIDTFPERKDRWLTLPCQVAFSPDGKRFAAVVPGDEPGTDGVRIYDWPRGRTLHTFKGHNGRVTALAFAPDGKTLASGGSDTTVLLWDLGAILAPK